MLHDEKRVLLRVCLPPRHAKHALRDRRFVLTWDALREFTKKDRSEAGSSFESTVGRDEPWAIKA